MRDYNFETIEPQEAMASLKDEFESTWAFWKERRTVLSCREIIAYLLAEKLMSDEEMGLISLKEDAGYISEVIEWAENRFGIKIPYSMERFVATDI